MQEKEIWLNSMCKIYSKLFNFSVENAQKIAWIDSFQILQEELTKLKPEYITGYIIFEYILPREGGRRPDVILIIGNQILIFEFKMKDIYNESDLDQAVGYARDVRNYHVESREYNVFPYLIPTKRLSSGKDHVSINAIIKTNIGATINNLKIKSKHTDIKKWLNSEYEPLPTLIESAISVFENKNILDNIFIHDTFDFINNIIKKSIKNNEHHLIFVSGVPGSGKTVLGLQVVYESYKNNIPSIFLSGNGPLVKVLSSLLKNNFLIKGIHKFIDTHFNNDNIPREHIIVFDEAQRAWEADYKKNKHKISEPEQILKICENISDWAVIIALIGDGQEIYLGEEGGLQLWTNALNNSENLWNVHIPFKYKLHFNNIGYVNDCLNLTKSIRSHLAYDISNWIEFLLNGNFNEANELHEFIRREGFNIYVTRNLEKAKKYCIEKYNNILNKTYGILTSSKNTNNSKAYGISYNYNHMKSIDLKSWYCATPENKHSCCYLNDAASEFECQGMELDMPIIQWIDDLIWNGEKWISKSIINAKNSHKLKINSYRVLLSRGRDGFIIFVPNIKNMDLTYQIICDCGIRPLVMN
jgi:DUF2075 family protein